MFCEPKIIYFGFSFPFSRSFLFIRFEKKNNNCFVLAGLCFINTGCGKSKGTVLKLNNSAMRRARGLIIRLLDRAIFTIYATKKSLSKNNI